MKRIILASFWALSSLAFAAGEKDSNGADAMKFRAFAFIFITPGFSPDNNTLFTEKNGYRFKAVGIDVNQKNQVIEIAKELAEEGYQMIELCGGFGPEWIHNVSLALENKVPVGGVFYGPQFRQQLADMFKPEKSS